MNPHPKPNGVNTETDASKPSFEIIKLYIKGLSFETSPGTLAISQTPDWKPQIHLDMNTKINPVENDIQEVVLTLTVTAKMEEEKVVFIAEVEQAGLFHVAGFPKEEMKHMLASFCPNILFPYAREVISNSITRGGFPPLYLAPINFDMLYQHHLEQEKEKDKR